MNFKFECNLVLMCVFLFLFCVKVKTAAGTQRKIKDNWLIQIFISLFMYRFFKLSEHFECWLLTKENMNKTKL